MRTTSMRPTFSVDLSVPADEAIGQICEVLKEDPGGGRTISAGRCAELFVEDRQRRIW